MKSLQITRRFLHHSVISRASTSLSNETQKTENENIESFGSFSKQPITTINSTEQRRRLLAELLRVDHAGELGAMAIYSGQLAIMKRKYGSGKNTSVGFGIPVSDLTPIAVQTLKHMQAQEKLHLDKMERLMASNNIRPTILAPLCHLAGYALGVGTALMGDKSAMACTIAVEELIGGHYNEQIEELFNDDPKANYELLKTLSQLRDEEMEHYETAVQSGGLEAPFYNTLKNVIQTGCKAAIWITKRI